MSYTWNVKTKVLFGAGKLKELHGRIFVAACDHGIVLAAQA